jgi:hypothetical protein
VIVVGVLVALGVDAMWGAKQERDLERFYLDQIEVDLEATRARLGPAVDQLRGATAASRELVVALSRSGEIPSDSVSALGIEGREVEWTEVAESPGIPSATLWMFLSLQGLTAAHERLYDASVELTDAIAANR